MLLSVKHSFLLALGAVSLWGCTLIDEDMRDCETDYHLDYELRLVTNMTTELQTQLTLAADVKLSAALKAYLQEVFTDYAHDVDLGFYDVAADSARLHHEHHVMDDNQSSYTLDIPVRRYQHLAVANVENKGAVTLQGEQKCHGARLHQAIGDTIAPHKTGLFTARLPMDIKEGENQQFDVRLYMANCASAIVLDTLGSGIKDLNVVAAGFATDFDVADSVYRFAYSPVYRTRRISVPDAPGTPDCFAAVTFPSHPEPSTKVVIDGNDPFVTSGTDYSLWQYRVYAMLADRTVTETVLGVRKALQPGQFKIVKVKVKPDGSAQPEDTSVGVSITLNWEAGMKIDYEF